MKSEPFGLELVFKNQLLLFIIKLTNEKENFKIYTICLIRQARSLELLGPGLFKILYSTIPDKFTDD